MLPAFETLQKFFGIKHFALLILTDLTSMICKSVTIRLAILSIFFLPANATVAFYLLYASSKLINRLVKLRLPFKISIASEKKKEKELKAVCRRKEDRRRDVTLIVPYSTFFNALLSEKRSAAVGKGPIKNVINTSLKFLILDPGTGNIFHISSSVLLAPGCRRLFQQICRLLLLLHRSLVNQRGGLGGGGGRLV